MISINKYFAMLFIYNFLFAIAMFINTNISSNFNIGIYTFITVFIHFVFVMRFSKIVFLIKKGILFI